MEYKLTPIAMTQVSWSTYINFVKQHLGYSPTRGLDDVGINPLQPQAFLATLDLNNQPNKQLSCYNDSWEHFYFSFMAVMPKSLVMPFYQAAPRYKIKFYTIPDEDDWLIIITGNMIQWHDAIMYGCRNDISRKIREIYNHIMKYFEQGGFKLIWSDFEKQDLPDGTFILRRR